MEALCGRANSCMEGSVLEPRDERTIWRMVRRWDWELCWVVGGLWAPELPRLPRSPCSTALGSHSLGFRIWGLGFRVFRVFRVYGAKEIIP